MKLTLEPVTTASQIEQVAALAKQIWHQHYQELLGEAQINYMVEKYLSAPVIAQQLQEGYRYYLAVCEGTACGFCAEKREEKRMFLSKVYVLKEFRRRGIASAFLNQVAADAQGLDSIYLTVNKQNTGSIEAYRKLGFVTIDAIVTDIGNGYVMDDYIMQKDLNPAQ